MSSLSAQASRVTNGNRRCRSLSRASSFNDIASWQIGREKHFGISAALRMGLYSKPAATTAASLMHVPPSLPGNWCDPASSFQLRMCSNPSMVVLLYAPKLSSGLIERVVKGVRLGGVTYSPKQVKGA